MNKLSLTIKAMIKMGYWPGFIVGMYPSVFAYDKISVNFEEVWKDTTELNLYIHIPFCKKKCVYCDFFTGTLNDDSILEKYVFQLCKELEYYSDILINTKIKSICFGGGTPNILPIKYIDKIMNTINKSGFKFDDSLIPSMEVSPELLDYEYIKALKSNHIGRLSLGLQSLNTNLRQSINRDKELNISEIISWIRKEELFLNIDVINGLKGQSINDFMETLNKIVYFSPESISIYPLSGSMNSMFKKNNYPTSKEKYNNFDVFYKYLLDNGYYCESHVKFVNSSKNITHQQKIYEYEGTETLGVGCGGRSYANVAHYCLENTNSIGTYVKALSEYMNKDVLQRNYIGFKMCKEENMRRYIIYSFFIGILNLKDYEKRFHSSFVNDFSHELAALIENELIAIDNDIISLTYKGRKYTDIIGTIFWSPYISSLYNRG